MTNALKLYENACNHLASEFLHKYYKDEVTRNSGYWIGSEPGGVLSVSDEFWSMDDIVNAIKYKPSRKKLFDYYYYCLDCYQDEIQPDYNMQTYLHLK